MKKLILIWLAVFLMSFLAFPSYGKAPALNCKDDVLFSGSCAPIEQRHYLGGIKYIVQGTSTGFASDPFRTPKGAFIISDPRSFFKPISALLYSILIASIVLGAILTVRRVKGVLR